MEGVSYKATEKSELGRGARKEFQLDEEGCKQGGVGHSEDELSRHEEDVKLYQGHS